jgi:hypothetical protein
MLMGLIKMTNKQYDVLKDISLCWFPAIMALTGVVMVTWEIPYSDQVLATMAGLNTFMGALVKYYKARYDAKKEN